MNANDRKLLEWAAKAAGISVKYNTHWSGFERQDMADEFGRGVVWSPLSDDGDAFRLQNAIKLNVFHTCGNAYAVLSDLDILDDESIASYRDSGSVDAATRRAIVRAAAAIGEQLEGDK